MRSDIPSSLRRLQKLFSFPLTWGFKPSWLLSHKASLNLPEETSALHCRIRSSAPPTSHLTSKQPSFLLRHHWHFEPNNSLGVGEAGYHSVFGCIPRFSRLIPGTTPLPPRAVVTTKKTFPDIIKCPLRGKTCLQGRTTDLRQAGPVASISSVEWNGTPGIKPSDSSK